MSTATPVSICSNALLMLGEAPLSSFDEDTTKARLAANLWPTARDYVLRRHPWNCAIKRVVLNPESAPPDFDFARQFPLPGDCLRVLQIGDAGHRPPYRIEGRKVLCDEAALKLVYVFRNEATAEWDALLVWGMTMVMRAVFSYGVTQSTSLEQLIETVMRDVLKQARAVDGQEEPEYAMDDNPLMNARYIGHQPWRV
jgi:hypothetical protein